MKSSSQALYSRSSSTTSHYAQGPPRAQDGSDGSSDVISHEQKMPKQARIPPRKSSASPKKNADYSHSDRGTMQAHGGGRRMAVQSSNTWTSSSGDAFSDHDHLENRTEFLDEFNWLAKKHNVRLMIPEEYEIINIDFPTNNADGKPGNWFSRNILRRSSSTLTNQTIRLRSEKVVRPRRSISDLSIRLKSKKHTLKDKDLQELVRLCGISPLYLPVEYAVGGLAVPTCFRATAQYLVQHGPTTRGVFRIPGAHSIVSALYSHYCSADEDGELISGTVRCPTLPDHIKCNVHDVASAFKKFLVGLPGGILGSLPLFDIFVSIHSQLKGDPEMTKTKQTKIRARLIALAIGTVQSQYRRDLICAVLGLLSMIGRAAETTRREDDSGRPLPTSDLMGYGPLGLTFGSLLIGDLLKDYTVGIANPYGALVLLPISPPKSRKEKRRKTRSIGESPSLLTHVDKIEVANSITEMLITHWRDVIRHMKDIGALKALRPCKSLGILREMSIPPFLRPSASEAFIMRKPADWDNNRTIKSIQRNGSPTPVSRRDASSERHDTEREHRFELKVRKHRKFKTAVSRQMLLSTRSMSALSPTAEETPQDQSSQHNEVAQTRKMKLSKPGTAPIKLGLSNSTLLQPPRSSSKLQKEQSPKAQLQRQDMLNDEAVTSPSSLLMLESYGYLARDSPSQHTKDSRSDNTFAHEFSTKENNTRPAILSATEHPREPQQVLLTDFLEPYTTSQAAGEDHYFRVNTSSHPTHAVAESEPNPPTERSPHGRSPKTVPSSKDHLSAIFHEDDIASLAKLARALESFDQPQDFEEKLKLQKPNALSNVRDTSTAPAARIKEGISSTMVLPESIAEQFVQDFDSASSADPLTKSKEKSPVQGFELGYGNLYKNVSNTSPFSSDRPPQQKVPQDERVLPFRSMFGGIFKERKPERSTNPYVRLEETANVTIEPNKLGEAHKQELPAPEVAIVMDCQGNRSGSVSRQTQVAQNSTENATRSGTSKRADTTTGSILTEPRASLTQYNHQASTGTVYNHPDLPVKKRQSTNDSWNRSPIITDVFGIPGRAISSHRPPGSSFIHSANDCTPIPPICRGGTVKALAAKFDTVVSTPSTSPVKFARTETPRKNLIASYTQNTSPLPSASKSQNSFRSIRSVRSTRSVPPARHQEPLALNGLEPPKGQAARLSSPRHLLRSSLDGSRPLRPILTSGRHTYETSAKSPRTSSNLYTRSLEIADSSCCHGERKPEDMKAFDGQACICGSVSIRQANTVSTTSASQVIMNTSLTTSHERNQCISQLNGTDDDPCSTKIRSFLQDDHIYQADRPFSVLVNGNTGISRDMQSVQGHLLKQIEVLENLVLRVKENANREMKELTKEVLEVNDGLNMWKKRAKAAEYRLKEWEHSRSASHIQKRRSTSSAPPETTSPLTSFSEDVTIVDSFGTNKDEWLIIKESLDAVEPDKLIANTIPLQNFDGAGNTPRAEDSGVSQDTTIRTCLVLDSS